MITTPVQVVGSVCSTTIVTRIAVFVATRWELQALRRALSPDRTSTIGGVRCLIAKRQGRLYCVVQTGVGPARAREVADAVLREGVWTLVLSTGFTAALVPANIGDLIIGTDIVPFHHDERWIEGEELLPCSPEEQVRLESVAAEARMTTRTGRIVSTARVVWQAGEKRAIRSLTDATALDMESAALAAVAHEIGIPIAIVRAVSDLVDEDLPLDFNLFLRPTGWITGLWALISRPASVAGLTRLRKQSQLAAERLAAFFRRYVDTIETYPPMTGPIA